MTNKISLTVDLEGKKAIATLNAINEGLQKIGTTGEKTGNTVDTSTKKMTSSLDTMIGTFSGILAVKAFDFLRQEVVETFDAFVEFEKGLIAVTKTANLTSKETEDLSASILNLTRNIPASTEELLSIATAAGQLGVRGTDSISLFTETIAKLGRVSNVSGDAAATSLTRILNVSSEGIDTIDSFASVIVSLGNNFAATESEIIAVTNEVARATAQFGVSSAEAAALAATLRSMGIRAEEAGGVLSKSFVKINEAIQEGGSGLTKLSELTGMSGDAIRKAFSEDAIGFFRDFVAGLKNAEGGLDNASKNLAALGIEGIRVQKVIPVLANNISEFDRALGLANKEMKNATALSEEYEKSLESTESKTQLLSNATERLRIRIGEKLAKAFGAVSPAITEFFDTLAKTDVELFAERTDDVDALNKKLKILNETAKTLREGGFLPTADTIEETEAAIGVITKRINEIEGDKAAGAIATLKTELASLNEQIANDDPLLQSMFGTKEELEARRKVVVEQLENINKAKILSGEVVAEAEADETNNLKDELEKRKSILDEFRATEAEAKLMQKEEEAIEKELKAAEDLAFLENALGAENAARELHRIKQIDDEKKRNIELKKLRDKAVEENKASLINLQKFENLTNKQKVQGQRDTLTAIAGLTSSSNGALYEVGKAAAAINAGINTSEAVTKALASVPYPFNFAAAALVGAAGAEQISKIVSAPRPKPVAGSFQEGGIVGGNSFSGDNLTANVNSGEAILNRRQQTNLFNAIDQNNIGGGGTTVNVNNPVLLSEEGVSVLIDEINDAIEFKNKELKVS